MLTNDIITLLSWMTCSLKTNIYHYLKLRFGFMSINTKGHYVTDTGAFCIASITAVQVTAEDTAKGKQHATKQDQYTAAHLLQETMKSSITNLHSGA